MGKVALLGFTGDRICVVAARGSVVGSGGGCAVSYTEGRGDASAEPLPVFGVVAVCPLKQGGVEAEVV